MTSLKNVTSLGEKMEKVASYIKLLMTMLKYSEAVQYMLNVTSM